MPQYLKTYKLSLVPLRSYLVVRPLFQLNPKIVPEDKNLVLDESNWDIWTERDYATQDFSSEFGHQRRNSVTSSLYNRCSSMTTLIDNGESDPPTPSIPPLFLPSKISQADGSASINRGGNVEALSEAAVGNGSPCRPAITYPKFTERSSSQHARLAPTFPTPRAATVTAGFSSDHSRKSFIMQRPMQENAPRTPVLPTKPLSPRLDALKAKAKTHDRKNVLQTPILPTPEAATAKAPD